MNYYVKYITNVMQFDLTEIAPQAGAYEKPEWLSPGSRDLLAAMLQVRLMTCLG